MDAVIGWVLLGGVLASLLLILSGVAWHWLRSGELGAHYEASQTNLFEFILADFHNLLAGAWRPRLLISLGVAVLLLTPYVRVLASLLFFALIEHNWKYAAFTGFVLAVLTYSLFLR
jgi:uncharacterized membrane protein